jgi:hypothetical protein
LGFSALYEASALVVPYKIKNPVFVLKEAIILEGIFEIKWGYGVLSPSHLLST